MKDSTIVRRFIKSLNMLLQDDIHLIENNLSEQSIAHKLAEKLQLNFSSYNVDCEYNGNVFEQNQRKKVTVLINELLNAGIDVNQERPIDETITKSVFPDIIVHKRGSVRKNILVLEIKKSSNDTPRDYDELKLKAFTSNTVDNNLNFQLGIQLDINTTNQIGNYDVNYFKNGQEVQ